MKSMTGYSIKQFHFEKSSLTVEIRAVNNRYLDFSIKTPKEFLKYEDEIRKIVIDYIKRGKVSVHIYSDFFDKLEYKITPNVKLTRAYFNALEILKQELWLYTFS